MSLTERGNCWIFCASSANYLKFWNEDVWNFTAKLNILMIWELPRARMDGSLSIVVALCRFGEWNKINKINFRLCVKKKRPKRLCSLQNENERMPYGEVEGRRKKKKCAQNEWSSAELSCHVTCFWWKKKTLTCDLFSRLPLLILFSRCGRRVARPSLSLATKLGESFASVACFFFLSFFYIHIVSVVPNHKFLSLSAR